MINIQVNFVSLCGLGFLLIAVVLPISALTERPTSTNKVVQGFVLAPFYFIIGAILVLYGWRFDPIMQASQILLFGLNVYWIITDRNRR